MGEEKGCPPFWQGFRVTDLEVTQLSAKVHLHPTCLLLLVEAMQPVASVNFVIC